MTAPGPTEEPLDPRLGWRERAELTGIDAGDFLLGECEDGYLWVPPRRYGGMWKTRFDARKPWHWPFWLSSRLRLKISYLERWESCR